MTRPLLGSWLPEGVKLLGVSFAWDQARDAGAHGLGHTRPRSKGALASSSWIFSVLRLIFIGRIAELTHLPVVRESHASHPALTSHLDGSNARVLGLRTG